MKRYTQTPVEAQDYIQSFQRGEESGFEYFFKTLHPALLYYAFRITNDKPIAEDVVANSFTKIWERHDSFNHPQVIKSWLYTTVRNDAINKLQQEDRKKTRLEKYERDREGDCQQPQLHDIIVAETIAEIHRIMQVLPPECKKIFNLLFIKGLTVREISDKTKLSVSTIKNQKARGLNIIRKNFPDLSDLSLNI